LSQWNSRASTSSTSASLGTLEAKLLLGEYHLRRNKRWRLLATRVLHYLLASMYFEKKVGMNILVLAGWLLAWSVNCARNDSTVPSNSSLHCRYKDTNPMFSSPFRLDTRRVSNDTRGKELREKCNFFGQIGKVMKIKNHCMWLSRRRWLGTNMGNTNNAFV
jgi:hypothetical protein